VGFQRAETAAACPDKHLFNMTIKTSQTANAHGAHSHTPALRWRHSSMQMAQYGIGHAICHIYVYTLYSHAQIPAHTLISNKQQTRLQPNDTENHSWALCRCSLHSARFASVPFHSVQFSSVRVGPFLPRPSNDRPAAQDLFGSYESKLA